MNKAKIVLIIILCLALLAAECAVLGLLAANRALSENTIRESVVETEIIEQLVDEAIAQNTVNMGGYYGDFAKEVFRTDAMEDFFVAYLTSAVNTELYGKPYQEVAYDELTAALSQGVDEVLASQKYPISEVEADLIVKTINAEVPTLTAAMDGQIDRYETLSGELTQRVFLSEDTIQRLLNPGSIFVAVVIWAVLCMAVVTACRPGKTGFLWCGVVAAIGAVLCKVVSKAGVDVLPISEEISPSEEMIIMMLTNGFAETAIIGAAAAMVFFIVFGVLKIIDRRTLKDC